MFRQDFTCPALLKNNEQTLPIRGYHPLWRAFPNASGYSIHHHWPGPRSLVTTSRVSVDFLSSGYLDISVHRVRSLIGWPKWPGFPIRTSTDQSLFAAPRSFSQRITSFIASQRQGIHQMPLRRLIRSYVNPIALKGRPLVRLSHLHHLKQLSFAEYNKPLNHFVQNDQKAHAPKINLRTRKMLYPAVLDVFTYLVKQRIS